MKAKFVVLSYEIGRKKNKSKEFFCIRLKLLEWNLMKCWAKSYLLVNLLWYRKEGIYYGLFDFIHYSITFLFFLLWAILIWLINSLLVEYDLVQMLQIWSLLLSWTPLICVFKSTADWNNLSQNSHLCSFWPSWTNLMCLFILPSSVKDFPQ